MYTANTTSHLKLMKPLDSDQFESQDYADTFQILDDHPGVSLVDSYAGLGALAIAKGYGTAQHGLMAFDRHNNALWWWSCPSGVGTWVRANSVGLLKKTTQSIAVGTAATTGNGILVATSGILTVPGGRTLRISVNFRADNTSGANGIGVFYLYDGSTSLGTWCFRVGAPIGALGSTHSFDYDLLNPVAESQHEFKFYARSIPGSTSNGAGGTTTCRYSTLSVAEV